MKRFSLPLTLILISLITISGFGFSVQTQQPATQEIIRRFAQSESENKIARNNYTFTQDVEIMTIGEAGSITGRFKRVSEIVYDDLSNRIERITYFPQSTLTAISITKEDFEDLAGVQPFALTTEDLPKYDVKYLGKERIDELDLYTFDVKPKELRKGERYFEGRIWVDDQDLQIVKTAGKGVPEIGNNRYPRFESYRENIDGKYWFPTYAYADDNLEFKNNSVHIRMIVRYKNYKQFTTNIRVVDEGDIATEEDLKAAEKQNTVDKVQPAESKDTKNSKDNKDEKKKDEKKPPQKKP